LYGSSLYANAPAARDPTEPFGAGAEADATGKKNEEKFTTSYVLDAVLISGNDKFAIINNKLIKVGDTVGTSKVKKIDSYQVTLVGETGEIVLELFGHPIKKPVKETAK
jgi:hypothetical protein